MIFEQSWRWYGPKDSVSLSDIKQAGAHGVVTSLHDIPVGDVWPVAAIKKHIELLDNSNTELPFELHWNVVESLPVHEHIKQGREDRDLYIDNYITSLENLAACGVKTICYNFMPVLDWLRTNVSYQLGDGSKALCYNAIDLAIFDRYILKREGAEESYSPEILQQAEVKFKNIKQEELEILKNSLLMALPGDQKGFTLEKLKKGLADYSGISAEKLRENLIYFLRKVIPIVHDLGVDLAIHPDDPPWSVFGLPRVVGNAADLTEIFEAVPQTANGLTFCSGSLGASQKNDLVELINRFYERIHFVHLRSVHHDSDVQFYEADHLEGSAGMEKLVNAFYENQQKHNRKPLPMRPDHGHQMLDDLSKTTYPGYSAIGRLRGLAELRGLERGIIFSKTTN
ncbi:mannonate dehydratase [Flavimarina sp. Hel_I_48]|uniref:mannonate dehydratase n=1 Tax=Flavimarina sp. Hel_I_48 TaxID=1392488 RepID=UPI0004DEDA0B|nr:mannonate dehydratase [Flavimarina sp. Hel_I_48]